MSTRSKPLSSTPDQHAVTTVSESVKQVEPQLVRLRPRRTILGGPLCAVVPRPGKGGGPPDPQLSCQRVRRTSITPSNAESPANRPAAPAESTTAVST